MKYLSVKQPYAGWIAARLKPVETRSRPTKFRGDLVICSTRGADGPGLALCVVRLFNCLPMEPKDWQAARCMPYSPAFGWWMDNVRPIKNPFPVRGQLGIWSGFNLVQDGQGGFIGQEILTTF